MKSLQLYKYSTWGLLVLNFLLLGFILLNKMQSPKSLRAIDTLKLDEQQHIAFLNSAKEHDLILKKIKRQQQQILATYFQQLMDEEKKSTITDDLVKYEQLESQKITATYQHFAEIKHILNPNQYADFELFMDRILKIILPEQKNNRHPPKDF